MHLLDSSVWIALFAEKDAHHTRALQVFNDIAGTIYLPYIVVEETASVLTYKHSKRHADTFVAFVFDHPRLAVIESTTRSDIEAFLNSTKKMSFADIGIVALAIRMRLKLVTFDKQMEREFGRISRIREY